MLLSEILRNPRPILQLQVSLLNKNTIRNEINAIPGAVRKKVEHIKWSNLSPVLIGLVATMSRRTQLWEVLYQVIDIRNNNATGFRGGPQAASRNQPYHIPPPLQAGIPSRPSKQVRGRRYVVRLIEHVLRIFDSWPSERLDGVIRLLWGVDPWMRKSGELPIAYGGVLHVVELVHHQTKNPFREIRRTVLWFRSPDPVFNYNK